MPQRLGMRRAGALRAVAPCQAAPLEPTVAQGRALRSVDRLRGQGVGARQLELSAVPRSTSRRAVT